MKRFTNAGRTSIAAGNLYAGLSLALTLPDICGSLEDPGPGKSRQRYVSWCKAWLEPKYTRRVGSSRFGRELVFLSGEDCYKLRCSLIHSGSAEFDQPEAQSTSRIEFFDETSGSHLNRVKGADGTTFLQLKVSNFSHDIFDAVDKWDVATSSNSIVKINKGTLLTIRSAGDLAEFKFF